jgi:hypothetical protein
MHLLHSQTLHSQSIKQTIISTKKLTECKEIRTRTSVAPTKINVPAVKATMIASAKGVATLEIKIPRETPIGPTILHKVLK